MTSNFKAIIALTALSYLALNSFAQTQENSGAAEAKIENKTINSFISDAENKKNRAKDISPELKKECFTACKSLEEEIRNLAIGNKYDEAYKYIVELQEEIKSYVDKKTPALNLFNNFLGRKLLDCIEVLSWESKQGMYRAKYDGYDAVIMIKDYTKEAVSKLFKVEKNKVIVSQNGRTYEIADPVQSDFMIKTTGVNEARKDLEARFVELNVPEQDRLTSTEYVIKFQFVANNDKYRIILLYGVFGKNGNLNDKFMQGLPELVK